MNKARLIRIRLAGVVCKPETGAQERQGHDEARKAGHHDQQARRHRQNGDHGNQLDDTPGGRRVARGHQRFQTRHLRDRPACGQQDQRRAARSFIIAHHSWMWMTRSRTLPPLRTRTRSLRSSRRCWKPLAPFDLWQRNGPQKGNDVLGDARQSALASPSARVHDDRGLQPDPGLGAGQIGDDGRQRLAALALSA